MEVTGKIKVINETQTFGTFQKREFVLTTDDQYPQMIQLELHQDKVDLIDSYNVGDDIKVSINIRGKEWVNPEGVAKYFNSIVGWRIEKVEAQEPVQEYNVERPDVNKAEPDDLPF
tara:strand:- start:29522 stop:29869 length:348 start_codon:yes stop_codon:yes gene_type:complete